MGHTRHHLPRILAQGGSVVAVGLALTAGLAPSESRAEATAKKPAAGPTRLYADSFLVWIYKTPKRDVTPIGYIRGGGSVALRAEESTPAGVPVKRSCGKGWYAVEPAGYVCLDRMASLTPTRYAQNMKKLGPRPGPYPFDFALSMGSPSYRRVPTQAEWTKRERRFGEAKPRPLPPHWQGHEELVSDDRLEVGAMPSFLQGGGSVSREAESRLVRREVPFGSMLAISSSFEKAGRQFLQSADGTIVPADRFRMFRPSSFEGVELARGGEPGPTLPLAWTRRKTRHYRLDHAADCAIANSAAQAGDGVLDEDFPELEPHCLTSRSSFSGPRHRYSLTGRTVKIAGTHFAELGDTPSAQSTWMPTSYLFVAEKRTKRGMAGTDRKWIHFTIGEGTLVTYRGDEPTFATLASPGVGGVPPRGADPLSTRTTPVGTYRIQFKHRSDDMSPEQREDRSYWIADVPYAMYFKQPFAIHVAYWHASFGEPMSGGCINVSPKDGKRLFDFADPPLPPDWYGAGASRALGYGTMVVIDR